jgi:hypothetical protein
LYGSVLFLDAQKRQMNRSGWPYIAPCVKNSEFQLRVAAESLVLQEDIATYAWTILTMQELEPQFEVSNIFIIFADEGITDSLPGLIHSGVPVCGDHYHLLKEVWPKHFGPHLWPSVEPFLQQMFCHGDFAEYEACFKKAMALPGIRGNTIHEEYLRAIHENPRQYAGYKRRSIPGNMGLMGSAPAKQNHSSVTA